MFLNLLVSLPRERLYQIKRMITVQSTHGLFLTCTQKFFCIYITYNWSSFKPPCEKLKEPLTYLEGRSFALGGESPSTLVSCLVATDPPLTPLTPFPPL